MARQNVVSDHARAVTAENTYVPLALAIGLCGATAIGVIYYFQDRGSIDRQIQDQAVAINRRIDEVSTNVDKLTTSINTLSKAMVVRTEDRFYRQDAVNMCLRLMILNKGFQCPPDLMGPNRMPSWTAEVQQLRED